MQAVTEQRQCTSCGEPVDGMRFCTNCGTPTGAAPAPPTGAAPEPVTGPAAQPGPTSTPPRGTRAAPAAAAFGPAAQPAAYAQAPVAPPQTPGKQGPGRGKRPRSVAFWALVGVLAVLIVGGGAFALGTIAVKHDDNSSAVSESPVAAPTTSPTSSAAPRRSTQPKASTAARKSTGKTRAGAKAARSLSRLISDSVKAKSAVSSAVSSLDSCRNVKASIRTLDDAATSRSGLVTRARRIDTGGAPVASTVVSQLVTAWQKSAKADSAFADYGRSLHHTHKGKCVGHQAWRDRGVRLSAQSHPAKQAAARAWNKLARTYGFATIAWGEL